MIEYWIHIALVERFSRRMIIFLFQGILSNGDPWINEGVCITERNAPLCKINLKYKILVSFYPRDSGLPCFRKHVFKMKYSIWNEHVVLILEKKDFRRYRCICISFLDLQYLIMNINIIHYTLWNAFLRILIWRFCNRI